MRNKTTSRTSRFLLFSMAALCHFCLYLSVANAQVPAITDVSATRITDATAVITWTTNLASDSRVDYGTDTSYGNTEADPKQVTSHSIKLSGLSAETTYHFKVLSKADGGATAESGDMTFTTITSGCGKAYDITITSITPSSISAGRRSKPLDVTFKSTDPYQYTASQFRIVWEPENSSSTDRRSGLSATSVQGSGTNWTLTFQSGPLSQPSQTIFVSFGVSYPPCSGNPQFVTSNVYSALVADNTPLDTTPPVISGVQATPITATTVEITWTTDEPSDGQLEYGKTTGYGGSTPLAPALTTSHSFRLTGVDVGALYHYRVTSADDSGNKTVSQDFTFTAPGGTPSADLFVPIVLSASGLKNSFYSSELTLTNTGTSTATLEFTYAAAAGGGSGTGVSSLPAKTQQIVSDAIAFLRSLSIPIPASGNRSGTLMIKVTGSSSSSGLGVAVRTTTPTPEGRAGLAYSAIPVSQALSGVAYVCGLRQNSTDRSNVAVQNVSRSGGGSITVRLTVFSGNPASPVSKALPDLVLAPGGFFQYNEILVSNGLSLNNGYVKVERVSGNSPYYAYGVVNDQNNSDGSFIPPVLENWLSGRSGMTLPVLVESGQFSSERILTNWSSSSKEVILSFASDGIQAAGNTVQLTRTLAPFEQSIIPDFVEYMRNNGLSAALPKGVNYAGPLIAQVTSGDASGLFLGARTSSPGGGGRYGVFYPAVPFGAAFTESVWLYGLQQNAENRSNLALVNTGEEDGSTDTFQIELFDGDTGGKVKTFQVTVPAKTWNQIGAVLSSNAPGTKQGYARVTRSSGNNPFIAYSVTNDGGQPGQRSGDGAFLMGSPE